MSDSDRQTAGRDQIQGNNPLTFCFHLSMARNESLSTVEKAIMQT